MRSEPETKSDPDQGSDKPRCIDCDEDCWNVTNKLECWLGIPDMPIAESFCPWLMEGIPFPPKP